MVWSIGELAERFGLETHVLRHWEAEGLLDPERDSGGRRRYRESDAYRVAPIVASKAAGMRLDQIRATEPHAEFIIRTIRGRLRMQSFTDALTGAA